MGGPNKKNVTSFPGLEVSDWKTMVEEQDYYNYSVVYNTTVKENPTLGEKIKEKIWENDENEWKEVKRLLKGEAWFIQWSSNVQTEAALGKDLIVIESDEHGYGNYQRAEIKYMNEMGWPFHEVKMSKLKRVNEQIEVLTRCTHVMCSPD